MWNPQIQCGIGGRWGRSFPYVNELVLPDRNVVRRLRGMFVSLVGLLSVLPPLPVPDLLINGTLPLPLLPSRLRLSTFFVFSLFCFWCLCHLCMSPELPDVPDTRHLPHRGVKKTRHHPLLVQERLGPLPDSPSHRPALPLPRWDQLSFYRREGKTDIFWNYFLLHQSSKDLVIMILEIKQKHFTPKWETAANQHISTKD